MPMLRRVEAAARLRACTEALGELRVRLLDCCVVRGPSWREIAALLRVSDKTATSWVVRRCPPWPIGAAAARATGWVLHTPAARTLLTRQLITVVDGAAWDAEARQARALQADMVHAIAAAEQREFDRLRVGVRICERRRPSGRPRHRWTAERVAEFRALLLSEAKPAEIAAKMGWHRAALHAKACQLGLARRAQGGGLTSPRPPHAV